MFSITGEITKKLLITIRKKKKERNKNILLARSKVNSIENIISTAIIDNKTINEDFAIIKNEQKVYRELKESITMMKSQRSYMERNKLIKDSKRMGINEFIKKNERIITIYKM